MIESVIYDVIEKVRTQNIQPHGPVLAAQVVEELRRQGYQTEADTFDKNPLAYLDQVQ